MNTEGTVNMIDEEKYLTSKEFTTLCRITKNALVWYEKKGLIEPKKVGENGYHYYSIEQYFDIDMIKSLKWADNSLDDCNSYLHNRSERGFMSMLVEQQERMEKKLQELRYQKAVIDCTVQDLISMQMHFTRVPQLVDIPTQHFLSIKVQDSSPRKKIIALTELFDIFHQHLQLYYGVAPSMFPGTVVPYKEICAENYNQVSEVILKIKSEVPHPAYKQIPAGKYLICLHKGNNETIGKTYRYMLDYLKGTQWKLNGDSIEREFVNYLMASNEEEYRKAVLLPVSK